MTDWSQFDVLDDDAPAAHPSTLVDWSKFKPVGDSASPSGLLGMRMGMSQLGDISKSILAHYTPLGMAPQLVGGLAGGVQAGINAAPDIANAGAAEGGNDISGILTTQSTAPTDTINDITGKVASALAPQTRAGEMAGLPMDWAMGKVNAAAQGAGSYVQEHPEVSKVMSLISGNPVYANDPALLPAMTDVGTQLAPLLALHKAGEAVKGGVNAVRQANSFAGFGDTFSGDLSGFDKPNAVTETLAKNETTTAGQPDPQTQTIQANEKDLMQGVTQAIKQGATQASVPFMVTQKMKADLAAAGHTPEQIAKMTPQDAHDALGVSSERPNPAPPPAPEPVPQAGADGTGVDQPPPAAAAVPAPADVTPEVAGSTPGIQDHAWDVPEKAPTPLAGGVTLDDSGTPKGVVIDPNVPKTVDVEHPQGGTVPVDVHQAIGVHEKEESDLMHPAGPVPLEKVNELAQRMGLNSAEDIPEPVRNKILAGEPLDYSDEKTGFGAHEIATKVENQHVADTYGVDPTKYQSTLTDHLAAAKEKSAGHPDIPADLDTKPFTDEGDEHLLEDSGQKQSANVPDDALTHQRQFALNTKFFDESPLRAGEENAPDTTVNLKDHGFTDNEIKGMADRGMANPDGTMDREQFWNWKDNPKQRPPVESAAVETAAGTKTPVLDETTPETASDKALSARAEEPPTPIGVKNASVTQDRLSRGVEELVSHQGPTRKALFQKAVEDAQTEPSRGQDIAADIVATKRGVKQEDVAALLADRVRISREYKAVSDRFDQATTGTDKADAQARLTQLDEQRELNENASRIAGTEASWALSARQMLSNEDFSLVNQKRLFKMANDGKELDPVTEKKLKAATDKIADLEEKLAQAKEKEAAPRVKKTPDEAMQERIKKQLAKLEGQIKERLASCPV